MNQSWVKETYDSVGLKRLSRLALERIMVGQAFGFLLFDDFCWHLTSITTGSVFPPHMDMDCLYWLLLILFFYPPFFFYSIFLISQTIYAHLRCTSLNEKSLIWDIFFNIFFLIFPSYFQLKLVIDWFQNEYALKDWDLLDDFIVSIKWWRLRRLNSDKIFFFYTHKTRKLKKNK